MDMLARPVRRLASSGLLRAVPLLLAVLALLLAPGRLMAQPLAAEDKVHILREAEKLVREQAFASGTDFEKWSQLQKKYQPRLDRAETVPAFSNAVNQMLREFGISHLDLLTPQAVEASKGQVFSGIGVTLDAYGDASFVTGVLPGSPAEKAGIRGGDRLVAADGKPIESTNMLRGPSGSIVRVTVRRASGEEETVAVTRAKVSFRIPEKLTKIGEDAALISIPTFHADYDRANITRLMRQAMGRKLLIIDLRGNSGGEVRNMLHFLGFLLPSGQAIGTSVTRDAAEAYHTQEGGDPLDLQAVAAWMKDKIKIYRNDAGPFKGQVAVLTNRGSASASEIVAQALVELKGAILVGTQTAGAVLVSTYEELPDGYKMKVPHSEYVSLKGRRIEGKPLKPDVVVRGGGGWSGPMRNDASDPAEDPAVMAALKQLRRIEAQVSGADTAEAGSPAPAQRR
ncbi:S41 family peptidase [soil metagenome]